MSVAQAVLAAVRINILILAVASAYNIRLFAVKNFGRFLVHIWTGIRILEPYKGPGLFWFNWYDHPYAAVSTSHCFWWSCHVTVLQLYILTGPSSHLPQ